MTKEQRKKIKVAAVGDIHVKETSTGAYQEYFSEVSQNADVLVLCGDLTDHGLKTEAEILAKELQSLRIPCCAVFGNHDYESGQIDDVRHILQEAKVTLLEEENFEIEDVGIAGVKGFGGGFGKYMLSPFGEVATKDFAHESVQEALILEKHLSELKTPYKVVALHYSPITGTIEGEPYEIFPFLGTSRLEEPIERFDVNIAFHGHADYGTHEGKTSTKSIPVYNVAAPLMRQQFPNQQSYKVVEL